MKWWRRLFPGRRGRRDLDRELHDEIEFHLEMRAGLHKAEGLSDDDARLAAQRQFGNRTIVYENTRTEHRPDWLPHWLETVLRDVRHAARTMRRSPEFAVTAICAMALGIGSATAVFSVVDGILFRPLPYPDEDRLVSFGFMAPLDVNEFALGTDYYEWKRAGLPFQSMTSWSGTSDCDLTEQNPVRIRCARVEANFLETLGVPPLLGRNFRANEDAPGAPGTVLLTYGLWRTRFGADPGVVGKRLEIDGRPREILGVLPPEFELPTLNQAQALIPQALDPAGQRRPNTGAVLRAFARLKPGVTVEQARQAFQPLLQRSLEFIPAGFRKEVTLRVRSLRDRQTQNARTASWVLLGSVLAVLLIACANVANLLLAHAESRRHEMAMRAALGASRGRLSRQALVESLLLGVCGGLAGCGLAALFLRIFTGLAPGGVIRLSQAGLDGRVLLFALGASLLSGLVFGLAPALHQPRPDELSGSRATGGAKGRLRYALISTQVALSLILLNSASALLRHLWEIQSRSLGLEPGGVMTAMVSLGQQRYSTAERQALFYDQLEQSLIQIPGVSQVSVSDSLPPSGPVRFRFFAPIEADGHPRMPEGTGGQVAWRLVTPAYFQAMQIPIIAGRGFTDQDRDPGSRTIVISQTLTRKLFPGGGAVGKRMRLETDWPWHTIVGIAADVANNGIQSRSDPEFYLARKRGADEVFRNQLGPDGRRRAWFLLRSAVNPASLAPWIRREAAALDPTLPVEIETMQQKVSSLANGPRFNALLLSLFAGIGLLLAAIGLYGVVAYLVAQRTREIGIRMALGSPRRAILELILGQLSLWVLIGAVAGAAGAYLGQQGIKALLPGTASPWNWALGISVVVLSSVAGGAALWASRKATAVDPVAALR